MKLIRFKRDGAPAVGRLDGDTVVVLAKSWTEALLDPSGGGERLALASLKRLAPITDGRIFCAAVNYAAHREEMGRGALDKPMLFLRVAESLVGPDDPVEKPPTSDTFDYEGELAVIIGTPGRRIARADALSHVAGWSLFMDGTIREWQRHTSQFTPGKNFDRSGSMGPFVMTPDEFGDYKRQTLVTRLNGQEVQRTGIDLMLYDVEALIEYISGFTTLRTGDVIASGTCGGVGDKRVPPLFMFEGDTVEIEVSGLGVLTNYVSGETTR